MKGERIATTQTRPPSSQPPLSSSSVDSCGFSLFLSVAKVAGMFFFFLCQGNLQGIKPCSTVNLLILVSGAETGGNSNAPTSGKEVFYFDFTG